jgi:hypothetical protein
MIPLMVLSFLLCGPGHEDEQAPPDSCEYGSVTARTCEAAESFIRQGIQANQILILRGCVPHA